MIFVTGASGNVGTAVVECLRTRQVPFRIGSRKLTSIVSEAGIESVPFDFLDVSTFRSAVRGCNAVFLLRPPAISDTQTTLNPFLDVAREEGVQHVVFVSVAGAADNPIVPHHAVEQHLRQGKGWTILRPGFFAQNLGDAYRDDIVQDDRIFVPAGAGRVAFIDVRDLAEVAVNALVDPKPHQEQSYTLTGAESLTFAEVASILSDQLGRAIAYDPASVLGYCWHLFRRRMPPAQILVQTILHVGLRFGQAETVDATLGKILGHPPRTMRDYVHDYRNLWLKPD
ncbi:NmrA family NAD(P)-binding protein [Phormidesmis priestleyi]